MCNYAVGTKIFVHVSSLQKVLVSDAVLVGADGACGVGTREQHDSLDSHLIGSGNGSVGPGAQDRRRRAMSGGTNNGRDIQATDLSGACKSGIRYHNRRARIRVIPDQQDK